MLAPVADDLWPFVVEAGRRHCRASLRHRVLVVARHVHFGERHSRQLDFPPAHVGPIDAADHGREQRIGIRLVKQLLKDVGRYVEPDGSGPRPVDLRARLVQRANIAPEDGYVAHHAACLCRVRL